VVIDIDSVFISKYVRLYGTEFELRNDHYTITHR